MNECPGERPKIILLFFTREDPRGRCAEGQSSSASTRGQIKISQFWASHDKARSLLCQKVQKRDPLGGGRNFASFRRKHDLFLGPFFGCHEIFENSAPVLVGEAGASVRARK